MTRISTGDIIARSYGFAFGNFFGILGIVWLPLAVLFAGIYLLVTPYIHAMSMLFAHLPQAGEHRGLPPEFVAAMQSLSRYAILFVILGLFLRAVMMLGVTREALDIRKGLPFVFFAIGKDVWRLFGAYFIFYILLEIAIFAIIFVIAIPAVIVGVIAAAMSDGNFMHNPMAGVLVGLGIFAIAVLFYGALFYFLLRLGFLLTPVVVMEKKIDLARIWNLAKGNIWRLFLVCVAIFLPVMIVNMLVMVVVLFHAVWPALASMPTGSHIPPEVFHAHMSAFLAALWSERFVFLPLAAIFSTLIYGLFGGAMAFTYRALVPLPVEVPAPQTA